MTSLPPAVITWSKFNDGLAQSRTVVKDGQLTILHAKMADFGSYECKASNILGHDSAWTHLSVFQLPRFTKTPPAWLYVEKWKTISEGPLSSSEHRCRPELKMDPWVILPMERERHSQQFLSCQPTDGFITGTQVEC